jgi:hypothetical protein
VLAFLFVPVGVLLILSVVLCGAWLTGCGQSSYRQHVASGVVSKTEVFPCQGLRVAYRQA